MLEGLVSSSSVFLTLCTDFYWQSNECLTGEEKILWSQAPLLFQRAGRDSSHLQQKRYMLRAGFYCEVYIVIRHTGHIHLGG